MSTSDWIALGSMLVALLGLGVAVVALVAARRANTLSNSANVIAERANLLAKQSARRDLIAARFDAEIEGLVLELRFFTAACEAHNAGTQRDDMVNSIFDIRRARFDRAAQLRILGVDTSEIDKQRTALESIWDNCLDAGSTATIASGRRDSLVAGYKTAHQEYAAALNAALRQIT